MDFTETRILSRREVASRLGVSTLTLDRMTARGESPRRVQISPRRVGYVLQDVEAWLRARAGNLSATT